LILTQDNNRSVPVPRDRGRTLRVR